MSRLTPIARTLRTCSTDAERLLWSRLRANQIGVKFVRQFPIGNHVVDSASRSAHLVIELDGGQHSPVIDARRTREIEAIGYCLIRFWNHEVADNLEGVVEAIARELALAR